MHIDLTVLTSEEYFSQTDRVIDWDEDNSSPISTKQADEIQKILATEASIFLLRRATGGDDILYENMVGIRRELITKYEKDYEKYVEYNDFY